MELQQLRVFLAVGEELSFRRAAERLHLAQPAVSRRIQALERELGVRLLERTTRHVRLTSAGAAFLDTVRASLATLDHGVRVLRQSEGVQDRLVVGYVEYASLPFLLTILHRFADAWPEVPIEHRENTPERQLELVAQGEVDVAFVGLPDGLKGEGLARVALAQAHWKVVVGAGHRLAGRDEVGIAELAGERLVLFPRFVNPGLYDWTLRCLSEAGQEPRVVQEPTQLHTALSLVAAGAGVMPTTFFLEPHLRPALCAPRLSGFGPGAAIGAVYRKDNLSPVLASFLSLARQTVREAKNAGAAGGEQRS